MSYYLLDHPNPHKDHFYATRRGSVLAIVVHITAGLEDLDTNADQSAEATARYAATTPKSVSWHSGSDTDSSLDLLPAEYTAFHVKGYNSRTYGHEISKAHTDWSTMDPVWVTATLTRAADHLGPIAKRLGIPLRWATRAELDHAIATNGDPVGFIDHHQLDPDRRSDPGLTRSGDTFPRDRFLGMMADEPEPPQEIDTVSTIVKVNESNTLWNCGASRAVVTQDEATFLVGAGLAKYGPGGKPLALPRSIVEIMPEVKRKG